MDWREERDGREEREGKEGGGKWGGNISVYWFLSFTLSPPLFAVFLHPFFLLSPSSPPSFSPLQKLDIQDNPNLVMPPKPTEQVKGSGAEWYNIDFDPEILKGGAVVASATVILSAHHKRKAGV